MTCAVYQIVNERTLKFYIGSAKNYEGRYGLNPDWTKHHTLELRQDALSGDEFIYCKIQECSSRKEAYCMEQWWLDFYITNKMWDKLYNKDKFVDRAPSGPEFSELMKKVMASPGVREKHLKAQRSPETRARKSAAHKGKKRGPTPQFIRAKQSAKLKGKRPKWMDDEERVRQAGQKISAKLAGRKQTEEFCLAQSARMIGKKRGKYKDGSGKNISKALKKFYVEHPERCQKISEEASARTGDKNSNCKLKEQDIIDIANSERTDYVQLAAEYDVNIRTLKRRLKIYLKK